MATILVRKLVPSIGPGGIPAWDVAAGQGIGSFLSDGEAVAQIIRTRLLLLAGEFFLNPQDGLPLFQDLLSHPITLGAVALILQNNILGGPYVTAITAMTVSYNPPARGFTFTATVQTAFGAIGVSG